MSSLIIKGKKFFLAPGIVAGYLLTPIAGVAFVFSLYSVFYENASFGGVFISFVFLVIGLTLATTGEGFALDETNKSFQKFTFFMGKRFGEWEQLPEIEAVTIAHYKHAYNIVDGINPSLHLTENKFKVMLYVKDADNGIIISLFEKKKAISVAKLLADKLNVDVWDYTTS